MCQHHISERESAAGHHPHQSSRDSRVSDQIVCIRAARYSHKCAHLLVELEPIPRPLGEMERVLSRRRPLIGLGDDCGGLVPRDSMRPIETSHAAPGITCRMMPKSLLGHLLVMR